MKITEVLQVLSDSTRLRMLRLLGQEELSVAELQKILEMGQSRISSHLGLLKKITWFPTERMESAHTMHCRSNHPQV